MLSAGPDRLTAAGAAGVPQVVSVGATDMVNFHARETVPEQFRGRKFYQHNANVTLMRTTAEENARLGADIGRKLAAARGPTVDHAARAGRFGHRSRGSAVRRSGRAARPCSRAFAARRAAAEIVTLDCHINDPEFADAAAARLIGMIES